MTPAQSSLVGRGTSEPPGGAEHRLGERLRDADDHPLAHLRADPRPLALGQPTGIEPASGNDGGYRERLILKECQLDALLEALVSVKCLKRGEDPAAELKELAELFGDEYA